jgi:hypothetical protein
VIRLTGQTKFWPIGKYPWKNAPPEKIDGILIWKDKEINITGGTNKIKI